MSFSVERSLDTRFENLTSGDFIQPVPISVGPTLYGAEIGDVANFPSPASKTVDEAGLPFAFQYPGKRPNSAFSVIDSQVAPLDNSRESGQFSVYVNTDLYMGNCAVFNLNDLLKAVDAAAIEDRYPVVAFGSNANPGQLVQKFTKLEGADKYIVPALKGTLKGAVPVYAARIGINGYVFTDLYPTRDPQTRSEVFVNLLSKPQFQAMEETEKAYGLCQLPGIQIASNLGEQLSMPAYGYLGRRDAKGAGILCDDLGRPIRLAEINAVGLNIKSQFGCMTQSEVQSYIYEIAGRTIGRFLKLDAPPDDEVDLAQLVINRKIDPRLEQFREYARGKVPPQPLGRELTTLIQQAIRATGRTRQSNSFRSRILPRCQDINLESTKSLSDLISV